MIYTFILKLLFYKLLDAVIIHIIKYIYQLIIKIKKGIIQKNIIYSIKVIEYILYII